MIRKLALLAAGAALVPLTSGLMRGSIQTQRVGPGPTHPQMARPFNRAQSRRSFMRWAMLGGLAVAGAEFSLVFVRFFWPNRTEAFGSEILAGTLADLPAVGDPPRRNNAGRFYLMHNEDGLLAFYWKCTHLGCTVPWSSDLGFFRCPCHGSEFDRHGVVIGGPAPRPMDIMEVKIDGNNVIVDTGNIIQRSGFNPEQVTRI